MIVKRDDMVLGLFEEKKPQPEVLNNKINESATLLWSYETDYNLVWIKKITFIGTLLGAFLGISSVSGMMIDGILGAFSGSAFGYLMGYGVSVVSVSSDGNYIAAGSRNGNLYFMNKDGSTLWKYKIYVTGISFSSDSSHIVAVSNSEAHLFNPEGELLWNYKIEGGISGFSASSDCSLIAAWSTGNPDFNSDDIIYFLNRQGSLLWSHKIKYCGEIKRILVSSDGSYVAIAAKEGDVYFVNCEGKLLRKYWINNPEDISISSNDLYIAVGSDNEVRLFNYQGKLLWKYRADSNVTSVSAFSDGSCMASTLYNMYFLNKRGKLLRSHKKDRHIVCASISSDGSYLTVGSFDKNIYFFDKDGELLWKYKTGNDVRSVAISSDGSYIAAGSMDRNVYFFNFAVEKKKAV